jgi:hypothetical protein
MLPPMANKKALYKHIAKSAVVVEEGFRNSVSSFS